MYKSTKGMDNKQLYRIEKQSKMQKISRRDIIILDILS